MVKVFSIFGLLFILASNNVYSSPIRDGSGGLRRFDTSQGEQPLRYFIHDNFLLRGDTARKALRRWQNVETSYLTFIETTNVNDAHITIGRDTGLSHAKVGHVYNDSGLIIRCEYEASDDRWQFDELNFLIHLMHEFGHCFGLGHSTAKGAIMSYNRQGNSQITPDDAIAITRLYPFNDNGGDKANPQGCGTIQNINSGGSNMFNGTTSFMVFFFLILGGLRVLRLKHLSFVPLLGLFTVASASPISISDGGFYRFDTTQGEQPLRYYIAEEAQGRGDTIRAGLRVWQDVPTSYISFIETTNLNDAHFTASINNNLSHSHVKQTRNDSFLISRCDLEMSKGDYETQSQVSFFNFIIHEYGHCLGLGHSTAKGAVMSYNRAGATNLTPDDVLAITRLYPFNDNGGNKANPQGCATIENVGGGPGNWKDGMSNWIFATSLLLFGLFLLRRRGLVFSK